MEKLFRIDGFSAHHRQRTTYVRIDMHRICGCLVCVCCVGSFACVCVLCVSHCELEGMADKLDGE